MKSILDKTFVYVPSDKTDIRKLFERVRLEQAAQTYKTLESVIREIDEFTEKHVELRAVKQIGKQ